MKRLISMAAMTLMAAGFAAAEAPQAGVALEVIVTKPKAGVTMAQMLAADKIVEKDLISKQKGFLSRESAVSQDGKSLFVIVHWATLKNALAAADAFFKSPLSKTNMGLSEVALYDHYVIGGMGN